MLARTYDQALVGSGMNVTQLAVIRCIARRAGEPLSRVAEELEMDRTSLYRAIAPMVRDRWLEVTPGTDARSRSAKITRKGSAVLDRAGVGWERTQKALVDAFGGDAWKVLAGEMMRLAECAQRIG